MKMSNKGVELVQRFEGCRLLSYVCPAGVLTIGYGHTGPDVKPGQGISQYTADTLLRQDLAKFETAVLDMTGGKVTQNEFDALVSLAFNIGSDALRRSTLMRRFNAGDKKAAAEQFLVWSKGGGKVLPGLVRRRVAERDHFLGTGA